MQKNIVILGGSYGGVSTAHYLLKHAIPVLPDPSTHRVIIVSTASQAMCRPACPRAMISDDMFDQKRLFVNIEQQFMRYPSENFRFVHGTATKVDHESRTITVSSATGNTEHIAYHALVIATGASTPSPLLGLNQDVDVLKAKWEGFRAALPKAKTIVIAGGGPAGVEAAGELGEYLNGRPGWFASKMANPKVSITVVTSGSQILPALRSSLAARAETYLAKVGVKVMKNSRVKSTGHGNGSTDDYTGKVTVKLENGKSLDADIYIHATGTTPNTGFLDKSLLAVDGRVETNPSTMRVDKAGPRVYAVGDVSSYARPSIHILLEAIPVLCANIKKDLLLAAGKDEAFVGQDRLFKEDTRETQMVPIGTSVGVGSAMGWALPSFMVWAIKGRDYWLWTTGNLWSGKQWAKES